MRSVFHAGLAFCRGIPFAGDRPIPRDVEVSQWIQEHSMIERLTTV